MRRAAPAIIYQHTADERETPGQYPWLASGILTPFTATVSAGRAEFCVEWVNFYRN